MTNKEQYAELCRQYEDIPIFMQDWWLDGVCAGKRWDVLISYDGEGKPRAALPYLHNKRIGFRYILMPQQTQTGGIWIRPELRDSSSVTREVCEEFTAQLKDLRLAYYYQQYLPGAATPAVMRDLGFRVKERVTYRIEDLSDLDKVLERFSKNKKRQLRKALTLHADFSMTAEDFYRFHARCMEEQGKHISYTREFFLVIYQKAIRRQQCDIVRIQNADGETTAAAFLVHDKRTLYYLIPCYSPRFSDSGAGALLVWESLKLARQYGVRFDFEGSMISGVARHYKQFGSVPVSYCSVQKLYNPFFYPLLLANRLREVFHF